MITFGKYMTPDILKIFDEKSDEEEVLTNICFQLCEQIFPDLLGRIYIDKHFDKKWMEDMKELVISLRKSTIDSIRDSFWLDTRTMYKAIDKLNGIKENIAFPKWTFSDTELDYYYQGVLVYIIFQTNTFTLYICASNN